LTLTSTYLTPFPSLRSLPQKCGGSYHSNSFTWNLKLQSIIILPNLLLFYVFHSCSFHSWGILHSLSLHLLTVHHPIHGFILFPSFAWNSGGLFQQFFCNYPNILTPSPHNHESFQIICLLSIQPSISLFVVLRLLNTVRDNKAVVWIGANDLVSRWVFSRAQQLFFKILVLFSLQFPISKLMNNFTLPIPSLFYSFSTQ
jgi:hypothetical protein